MKLFSLFSGKQELSVSPQDRAERLLVESFRLLSQVCTKMADFVETQRLSKAGFESQDSFLKRLDREDEKTKH